MAEIHVQRKRRSLWWLWLIIVLILLIIGYYWYTNYYQGGSELSGRYEPVLSTALIIKQTKYILR